MKVGSTVVDTLRQIDVIGISTFIRDLSTDAGKREQSRAGYTGFIPGRFHAIGAELPNSML